MRSNFIAPKDGVGASISKPAGMFDPSNGRFVNVPKGSHVYGRTNSCGDNVFRFKDGALAEEAFYIGGNIHGLRVRYAPSGHIENMEVYNHGKLHQRATNHVQKMQVSYVGKSADFQTNKQMLLQQVAEVVREKYKIKAPDFDMSKAKRSWNLDLD